MIQDFLVRRKFKKQRVRNSLVIITVWRVKSSSLLPACFDCFKSFLFSCRILGSRCVSFNGLYLWSDYRLDYLFLLFLLSTRLLLLKFFLEVWLFRLCDLSNNFSLLFSNLWGWSNLEAILVIWLFNNRLVNLCSRVTMTSSCSIAVLKLSHLNLSFLIGCFIISSLLNEISSEFCQWWFQKFLVLASAGSGITTAKEATVKIY